MSEQMKYAPTSVVKNNMQIGALLKSKYSRLGSIRDQSVIQKAKELKSPDELTLKEITFMHMELTKMHNEGVNFKEVKHDGGPSEQVIKYYMLGADAGLAWSRGILKAVGQYQEDVPAGLDANKQGSDAYGKVQVTKAVDEELKQVTYVVMVPDEVDLHGDITSEEEVRKACHNFNKYCQKANLFHLVQTDSFEFAESYIAPTDFILGDKEVKKGTWLATLQILDDDLWALVKSGDVNGVSIGALAAVETIENE